MAHDSTHVFLMALFLPCNQLLSRGNPLLPKRAEEMHNDNIGR